MLKLEDFKAFEIENSVDLKGGGIGCTVERTHVNSDRQTSIDVLWDDGISECNITWPRDHGSEVVEWGYASNMQKPGNIQQ